MHCVRFRQKSVGICLWRFWYTTCAIYLLRSFSSQSTITLWLLVACSVGYLEQCSKWYNLGDTNPSMPAFCELSQHAYVKGLFKTLYCYIFNRLYMFVLYESEITCPYSFVSMSACVYQLQILKKLDMSSNPHYWS